MKLLVLFFLASAVASQGVPDVQYYNDGTVKSVAFKLRVLKVESKANGTAEITTAGRERDKNINLMIILGPEEAKNYRTPGKDKQGNPTILEDAVSGFTFPVFFKVAGSDNDETDKLLSLYFPMGPSATIFKKRGYAGIARAPRNQLFAAPSRFQIMDGSREGDVYWEILVDLDLRDEKKELFLTVGRASYD